MQVTRTKLSLAVDRLARSVLGSVLTARTFSRNRQADLMACDIVERTLTALAKSDAEELRAIALELEGRTDDHRDHDSDEAHYETALGFTAAAPVMPEHEQKEGSKE